MVVVCNDMFRHGEEFCVVLSAVYDFMNFFFD